VSAASVFRVGRYPCIGGGRVCPLRLCMSTGLCGTWTAKPGFECRERQNVSSEYLDILGPKMLQGLFHRSGVDKAAGA
jgi:hypothetical protein